MLLTDYGMVDVSLIFKERDETKLAIGPFNNYYYLGEIDVNINYHAAYQYLRRNVSQIASKIVLQHCCA